jgi:hypothetical protein
MMKGLLAVVGVLCAAKGGAGQEVVSSVVVLTNENFEHLTQASTGQ